MQGPGVNGTSGGAERRDAVLLTGSTGVLGQALLPKLAASPTTTVLALVHQAPLKSGPRNVVPLAGDVTRARFGWSAEEFDAVARSLRCIVHAAAETRFSQPDGLVQATNVQGTANILDLAHRAGVPLYFLSSALAHADRYSGGGKPTSYEVSKREAERLVQSSGLPQVIIRPSIILGDSQSGAIAHFQGFYAILKLFVDGSLPVLPLLPAALLDWVPQDVVADTVTALVNSGGAPAEGDEIWLTAGAQALCVAEAFGLVASYGRAALDRVIPAPRFAGQDVFDRLIIPVFRKALPTRLRAALKSTFQVARYINLATPLPSSLSAVDPRRVLLRSVHHWATNTGLTRGPLREELILAASPGEVVVA